MLRFLCHNPKGTVFPPKKGEWLPQSTLDNVNRRIIKATKLSYLKIHGTRHSFATEAIENNVDLAEVGQYLGHHDLRITQTIYSHLVVHEINSEKMPAEMGTPHKVTM